MFVDKLISKMERETEPGEDKPIRSLAKAVSWRITGSLDTIMLAWLFTNEFGVAVSIGMTEVVTKIVLYYFHERIWNRILLGKPNSVNWST